MPTCTCRVDDFEFESQSLGDIRRLRIRYDHGGSNPGWFVDSITVQDLKTYQQYRFQCGQWLDDNIERELNEGGTLS